MRPPCHRPPRVAGALPARLVPFDTPTHRAVNDLAFTKIDMPDRQRATHLFDEAPEQHENIVVGFADQLEPITGAKFSAKLKGIPSQQQIPHLLN